MEEQIPSKIIEVSQLKTAPVEETETIEIEVKPLKVQETEVIEQHISIPDKIKEYWIVFVNMFKSCVSNLR
jgi:hypothetical protein